MLGWPFWRKTLMARLRRLAMGAGQVTGADLGVVLAEGAVTDVM